jgi:threonine/homoserine/homoserine lactone efflux protein
MLSGVGIEFALGVASLVLVPTNRPDEWIPAQGRDVYLAHAVIGGILGIGALLVSLGASRDGRVVLLGAVVGLVGLLLGAAGGMLTVSHSWRFAGIALMLAGVFIAFFGFLIALAEQIRKQEPEEGASGQD